MENFSAYSRVLRGSILLPPRHPSVFARMARWQKHTQFKSRRHKPYPISDENGRIDTLFQNKTAQKNIPFGAAHTYIVYIGDYPPPPPRAKNAWQIMSLAAYASETNNVLIISIILAKRYLHNDVS